MSRFTLYFANGDLKHVVAPSLRTAVRNAEKEISAGRIVAAIDAACLPPPATEGQPFQVVLLRNPGFKPLEIG